MKIVYTITEDVANSSSNSWKGERGRINKEMLDKYLDNNESEHSVFYAYGPPAMLNAMKDLLEYELKITKERIKSEEFTGY